MTNAGEVGRVNGDLVDHAMEIAGCPAMARWCAFALSWRMPCLRSMMLICVLLPTLAACSTTQRVPGRVAGAGSQNDVIFAPGQLAKTDVDRVADAYRQEIHACLRLLAEKLYRRNPGEMKKSGVADINVAVRRVMDPAHAWRFSELEGRYGTDAVQLAFHEDFHGDRVLAFIAGLGGMMQSAFNDKDEFYMTDDLEPQKLYNSARNVEIAVWRLSNTRMADGAPFLLSNDAGRVGQPPNLSFEREFGKIIGHFDMLSRIIADKSNRTIVKVLQSLATAVFLPVVVIK